MKIEIVHLLASGTEITVKREHTHDFRPAIAFDLRGEDTMYGKCDCGETDA